MVSLPKRLESLFNMPFTLCSSLYFSPSNHSTPHLICDSTKSCDHCVFFYKNISNNRIEELIAIAEALNGSETGDEEKDESTY